MEPHFSLPEVDLRRIGRGAVMTVAVLIMIVGATVLLLGPPLLLWAMSLGS